MRQLYIPVATENGSGIGVPGARLLHSVRLALLFGCAFLTSWLDGLNNLVGVEISKLFPLCACALILYWLIFARRRGEAFPRAFNLFMAFAVLHTVITYGILHRDEFSFGAEVVAVTDDGFLLTKSERGLMVARFFLFAGFGYAAAALLRNRRELMAFSLWFAAGLMVSFLLGTHAQQSVGSVLRDTGGFINANALGRAAMVAMFLCLMVIRSYEGRLWQRVCAILLLAGSLFALLSSVSRTPILVGAIGMLVMIALEPAFGNKVRAAFIVGIVALGLTMFLPIEFTQPLLERFNPDYVTDTEFGGRLPILLDYLKQWSRYIVNGMGYARAVEATRQSYSTGSLLNTHGTYLVVLVEFGAVGLFLFLCSLYSLWQRIAPSRPGCRRLPTDSLLAGFLMAWAFYFAAGTYGGRVFWLSWAVIAAYGRLRPRNRDIPLPTTGKNLYAVGRIAR